MDQPEKIVGEFGKNQHEVVRVILKTWNGRRLLDVRAFYRKGELFLPGRKGLTLQVSQIPELKRAVLEAERQAQAEGLLPAGEP